ncbi:class F sortase [Plantactinospora sp. ZYX-F-223]|uniref:class F sortase n=1 Tax=Plantactinospora sp. ZYX-F-223 TaxID=3144103 RepID=UPI0031FDF57B
MTAARAVPGGVNLLLCAVLGASLGVALTGDAVPAPLPVALPGPVALPEPVGAPDCPDGCPGTPADASRRAPTGAPTRVRIPRIRVDAALTRLRLDRSGRLGTPRDFAEAGWYAAGTAPGDVGPAVLAGHVDSTTGPAVFARLSELRPGDRVEVRRGDRWIPFRVTGASRHAKDAFPTDAVYGPTPGPELRLITCGGAFDRPSRHYRDNLVVFAVAEAPVVIPESAAG